MYSCMHVIWVHMHTYTRHTYIHTYIGTFAYVLLLRPVSRILLCQRKFHSGLESRAALARTCFLGTGQAHARRTLTHTAHTHTHMYSGTKNGQHSSSDSCEESHLFPTATKTCWAGFSRLLAPHVVVYVRQSFAQQIKSASEQPLQFVDLTCNAQPTMNSQTEGLQRRRCCRFLDSVAQCLDHMHRLKSWIDQDLNPTHKSNDVRRRVRPVGAW